MATGLPAKQKHRNKLISFCFCGKVNPTETNCYHYAQELAPPPESVAAATAPPPPALVQPAPPPPPQQQQQRRQQQQQH